MNCLILRSHGEAMSFKLGYGGMSHWRISNRPFPLDFPGGSDCKSICLQCGRLGFNPWLGNPLERKWHPTPVLLPGKSHGWRSLVSYTPWGHKESDTAERLHFHFHALEKAMATYSSVLAWRIPGTGEPGGLLCMASHRVGHD